MVVNFILGFPNLTLQPCIFLLRFLRPCNLVYIPSYHVRAAEIRECKLIRICCWKSYAKKETKSQALTVGTDFQSQNSMI